MVSAEASSATVAAAALVAAAPTTAKDASSATAAVTHPVPITDSIRSITDDGGAGDWYLDRSGDLDLSWQQHVCDPTASPPLLKSGETALVHT